MSRTAEGLSDLGPAIGAPGDGSHLEDSDSPALAVIHVVNQQIPLAVPQNRAVTGTVHIAITLQDD